MQVVIDNLLINYQVRGQAKKTVLILHGWGSNIKVFNDVANEISKEHKVLMVDLPGMGESQAPNQSWNLDDYKKFIIQFLAKLKIDNVYAVLAHSNGGSIAIKMAADDNLTAKLKLQKLVLMGSAGIRTKDKFKKKAFKVTAKIGKNLSYILPQKTQIKLKQKLYSAAGSEALDNPALEETFRRVVAEDVQNLASQIKLKSLLIYGSNDQSTPPKYGQLLNNLMPSSSLEIIKDAGHYCFLDQPKKTLNLVEEFLK